MVRDWIEEGVIDLNLFDKGWRPIPGYNGAYYINAKGEVCNRDEHLIKPTLSKTGARVELRKNGQREKILILDLLVAAGYNIYGGENDGKVFQGYRD